jgi:hypothetical protein
LIVVGNEGRTELFRIPTSLFRAIILKLFEKSGAASILGTIFA